MSKDASPTYRAFLKIFKNQTPKELREWLERNYPDVAKSLEELEDQWEEPDAEEDYPLEQNAFQNAGLADLFEEIFRKYDPDDLLKWGEENWGLNEAFRRCSGEQFLDQSDKSVFLPNHPVQESAAPAEEDVTGRNGELSREEEKVRDHAVHYGRNIQTLEDVQGGCTLGAMLKDYRHVFPDFSQWEDKMSDYFAENREEDRLTDVYSVSHLMRALARAEKNASMRLDLMAELREEAVASQEAREELENIKNLGQEALQEAEKELGELKTAHARSTDRLDEAKEKISSQADKIQVLEARVRALKETVARQNKFFMRTLKDLNWWKSKAESEKAARLRLRDVLEEKGEQIRELTNILEEREDELQDLKEQQESRETINPDIPIVRSPLLHELHNRVHYLLEVCETVRDLTEMTESDLRSIHGIGEVTAKEIKQVLHKYGLSLKEEEDDS